MLQPRPSASILANLSRIVLTSALVCSLTSLSGCGGSTANGGATNPTTYVTGTALSVQSAGVSTTVVTQGVSVTLTAVVISNGGPFPSGSVTFFDGATQLGTATLNAVSATLSMSFTTAGLHNLTAAYAGNSTEQASTSSVLGLTVVSASTAAPIVAGGATAVYGTNGAGNGTILQFAASGTGSVSPLATLTPPSGLLVSSVATDSAGHIFVGGSIGTQPQVLVYAAGASGSAAPLRTILVSGTCSPTSMTVDSAGILYLVDASSNCIAVFPATASGVSVPTRLISGTLTQLYNSNFITVDNVGNIYVSGQAQSSGTATILKFSSSATGNVAPAVNITAAVPTTTSVPIFGGIALDAGGNLYAALDTATVSSGNITAISSAIVEYSASASGNATPIRTIGGSLTGFVEAGGLRIDSAGNLYVLNYTVTNYSTFTGFVSVFGFGATATGNQPPAVNYSSSAWTNGGTQLAIH